MNCYKGALRTFLKAAPTMDPPLERIEIPFEGKKVVGYLQVPKGINRPAGRDALGRRRRLERRSAHQQ